MKHLFYGSQVIAISDLLAETVSNAAHDYASNGRSVMVPIAGYVDHNEITAEILLGPGIPLMIADPYLPDTRMPAKNDRESIAFVTDLINDLDAETSGD